MQGGDNTRPKERAPASKWVVGGKPMIGKEALTAEMGGGFVGHRGSEVEEMKILISTCLCSLHRCLGFSFYF